MRRRQRRSGFMTVVAVLLLGLLTAALALVAAAGVADVRRTRGVTTDAQLRQLLLAGGADVAARSAGWADPPAGSWSLAVPAESPGYAVTVRVRPGSAGSADVLVTAAGQGRHASQRMTWTRSGGAWRLVDLTLDGS